MTKLLLVFHILQLCELVSLQRYTKALTSFQWTNLVKESRQKPQEKMDVLIRVWSFNFSFIFYIFKFLLIFQVSSCRLWRTVIIMMIHCCKNVVLVLALTSLKWKDAYYQHQVWFFFFISLLFHFWSWKIWMYNHILSSLNPKTA